MENAKDKGLEVNLLGMTKISLGFDALHSQGNEVHTSPTMLLEATRAPLNHYFIL
jgi:hypothetical protein